MSSKDSEPHSRLIDISEEFNLLSQDAANQGNFLTGYKDRLEFELDLKWVKIPTEAEVTFHSMTVDWLLAHIKGNYFFPAGFFPSNNYLLYPSFNLKVPSDIALHRFKNSLQFQLTYPMETADGEVVSKFIANGWPGRKGHFEDFRYIFFSPIAMVSPKQEEPRSRVYLPYNLEALIKKATGKIIVKD